MPATIAEIESAQTELGAALTEVSNLTADNTRALSEFKAELIGLAGRGDVDPDNTAVRDLEKRLDEAETRQGDSVSSLTTTVEELRLIVAGLPTRGDGKKFNRCRGAFGDPEKLKETLLSWGRVMSGDASHRAIDTGVIATDGGLNSEQQDAFTDYMVSENEILGIVERKTLTTPEADLDKIAVSKHNTRKTAENGALGVANSVSTSKRKLVGIGTGWTEDITLEFLEDNIEREGAEDHILRLLGVAYGNDEADLFWNGLEADASPDVDFYSINDGLIQHITADTDTDVSSADLTGITKPKDVLRKILLAMPAKYRTLAGQTFSTPVGFALHYADDFSERETAAGDDVRLNGFPALRYFGFPVRAEPFFNSAVAGRVSNDTAVLTPNNNLVYGIRRGVEVFAEFKPRTRTTEVTIHSRTDYNYRHGEVIVHGTSIDPTLLT